MPGARTKDSRDPGVDVYLRFSEDDMAEVGVYSGFVTKGRTQQGHGPDARNTKG